MTRPPLPDAADEALLSQAESAVRCGLLLAGCTPRQAGAVLAALTTAQVRCHVQTLCDLAPTSAA